MGIKMHPLQKHKKIEYMRARVCVCACTAAKRAKSNLKKLKNNGACIQTRPPWCVYVRRPQSCGSDMLLADSEKRQNM